MKHLKFLGEKVRFIHRQLAAKHPCLYCGETLRQRTHIASLLSTRVPSYHSTGFFCSFECVALYDTRGRLDNRHKYIDGYARIDG